MKVVKYVTRVYAAVVQENLLKHLNFSLRTPPAKPSSAIIGDSAVLQSASLMALPSEMHFASMLAEINRLCN